MWSEAANIYCLFAQSYMNICPASKYILFTAVSLSLSVRIAYRACLENIHTPSY